MRRTRERERDDVHRIYLLLADFFIVAIDTQNKTKKNRKDRKYRSLLLIFEVRTKSEEENRKTRIFLRRKSEIYRS